MSVLCSQVVSAPRKWPKKSVTAGLSKYPKPAMTDWNNLDSVVMLKTKKSNTQKIKSYENYETETPMTSK